MEINRAILQENELYELYDGVSLSVISAGRYCGGEGRLELIYCLSGHAVSRGGKILRPGDMLAYRPDGCGILSFSGSGIALSIDGSAGINAPEWKELLKVSPFELLGIFISENERVLHPIAGAEHIFDGLCDIPRQQRLSYFRIKALELLLILRLSDEKPDGESRDMLLFRKMSIFIEGRLGEKLTISELAETFGLSPTRIRSIFKNSCGMTVGQYIRERKMRCAAMQLHSTDKTVLEIAGSLGYDNGSKFAAAFRCIMGQPPNAYRNSVSAR